MDKPLLVDLFCGAGGSSAGYAAAGFTVVGVDHETQKNYPYEFVQMDALEFAQKHGREFSACAASPPCQAYSAANNIHLRDDHPDLVAATREVLRTTGRPYVIENVPRSPLENPVIVCGLALGLGVKRHRLFESNMLLHGTTCPPGHPGDWVSVFGHTVLERSPAVGRTAKGGPIFRRKHLELDRGREAMGISWMMRDELSQAIPPAYTHYIGSTLMLQLEHESVRS